MFIDRQAEDHITLRDPGHSNKTLTSLAQLQQGGILCDAVIIVEEKRFNVHKNVLASNSEYFKTMFISPLQDPNQKEFTIETISSEAFQEIIGYIYNGCLNLDMITAVDLLHAGSLLLMKEVASECFKYLKRNMDLSNCMRIQKVAESYNNKDLMKESMKYILKNFEVLSCGREILNLSFKNIVKLLSNNDVLCRTEDTVLYLIKSWLDLRPDSTTQDVKLILKCLKMPHITKLGFTCLESVMKEFDSRASNEDEYLKALYAEQKLQLRTNKRRHIDCRSSQKYETVIFCINRRGESFCYDVASKRFRCLKRQPLDLPQPAQLLTHNNIVYAIGSNSNQSMLLNNTYSSRLTAFDPVENKWEKLPGMVVRRTRHGAAFLKGKLYVVGGKSISPENTGTSVECYDPTTKTWNHATSTTSKRISSAVAASNKHLYAIGGEAPEDIVNGLDTAERFCPSKNKWESLPKLNHRRVKSTAVFFNNKIYVFGGGNGIYDLRNFEFLNPSEKQWTVVAIPFTTPITTSFILNDRIMALGYSTWGDEMVLSNSFTRRSGLSWNQIKDFIHPSHRIRSMKYTSISMLNYEIDKKSDGHCDCTAYDEEDSESNMEYSSEDDLDDDFDDDDDEGDDDHLFGGWLDPDPWGLWV